jgi:flavin-dependent dehydrogenase
MLCPDVFVIGGGPAGLAAAIAARRQGFNVLLADCAKPPIDKACGEGLMPDSLASLERIGVTLDLRDSAILRGIRFMEGNRSVDAEFPTGFGAAVRRTSLHQQLVEHAEACGVKIFWNAKRISVTPGIVRVNDEPVAAEFVVGADGQKSRVRKAAGLDGSWYESVRYGFRQHFRITPWSDFVEVYWARGLQIYVTPVRGNEVGVALVSRNPRLRLTEAVERFPSLRRRLQAGLVCSAEMGALTVSRRLRRIWRGRIALTGDASGSVDSVAGEGLCLAFKEAFALAAAMKRGDLANYQHEHDRLNRRARTMVRLLLILSSRDRIRRGVLAVLSRQPELFAALLGIHVGQPIGEELRLGRLVELGRDLLGRR